MINSSIILKQNLIDFYTIFNIHELHLVCLYFQLFERVKRRLGGWRNDRFSIGSAKIDRPGNSRYYFMLHPLSGVLHVKRKARKRVVASFIYDRSIFCHYFAYGPGYRYLSVLPILRCVYPAWRGDLLHRVVPLVSLECWDKDETIDMVRGSRYKISAMRRRQLRHEDVARGVVRGQENFSNTVSMDLDPR